MFPLVVLFTRTLVKGKISPVVAKSTAGTLTPETKERTGALNQRLFLRPNFARKKLASMGLCGATFGLAGYSLSSSEKPRTVPAISASHTETRVESKKEAMVMANKPSFPVDDVTFSVCRARSLLKALQVVAEYSDEFQLHKNDTIHILHLAEDILDGAYEKIKNWDNERMGGAV